MYRRDFLIASGTFVTASLLASLMPAAAHAQNTASPVGGPDSPRDDYKAFATPILQAIAIGINAPSAHNTQSWKFNILNDLSADLYLDETRLLPHTDPPARQLHLSCGCLLETVAIGVALIGYEVTITHFPAQTAYTAADFGKIPVARIVLMAKSGREVHPLAPFIFTRQTNRRTYTGEMVPKAAMEAIIAAAKCQHSEVRYQTGDEMRPFLPIFKDAMQVESVTRPTNEETRRMFRFSDEEMAQRRDGLCFPAQGIVGMGKFFAQMAVKNTEESWNAPSNVQKGLDTFGKGVDSAKGLLYWISPDNTPADWLRTGHDIMRLWLELTRNGLYGHPLNQAIQEYDEVASLRTKLDELMGIRQPQKIQMIVRIGHAATPFYAYRRHADGFVQ